MSKDLCGIREDHPEPSSEGAYFGHMTMADGSHVALTADAAKALWEATERAQAKAEVDFPDEQTALREISRAMQRLRDFKWSDGIYCPKDGSEFEIIEAGSTGIFRCRYDGEWPDGMWLTFADGDVYPSSRPPLMFRLLPEAQAAYDRKMAEAAARFRAEHDHPASAASQEWPHGCPKRNSCSRNLGCMYGCKAHADRPGDVLKREIETVLADATKSNSEKPT